MMRTKIHYVPMYAQVEINEAGGLLKTQTFKTKPSTRGKRKSISGWSSSSRRRMREYMISKCAPDGYFVFGVTFTIPGPALAPEFSQKIFQRWKYRATKLGWCAIWRLELQKRGQLHWHLLLCVPPSDRTPTQEYAYFAIQHSWLDVLRKTSVTYPEPVAVQFTPFGPKLSDKGTDTLVSIPSLYHWAGSDLHACRIDYADNSVGAWLRYLQDHTSKYKQAQIAVSFGRHWGVIGRKHFQPRSPLFDYRIDFKTYSRGLRWLQRLATPHRKCKYCKKAADCSAAKFGSCLSWSPTRGRYGQSVWFSRPDTLRRIFEHAMAI